jgi:excisionase family DNA binding protein
MGTTTRPAAYSIPQAARELSVSRSHLYTLINDGHVRRVKIGGRAVIPATEIDRLLAENADPQ